MARSITHSLRSPALAASPGSLTHSLRSPALAASPGSLIALFVVVTTMGCLPGPGGPRPGAIPTGERVAVVDDVKRWTTNYQEKVGETEIKNSNGETVATEEHYQERTEEHAKKIWYPVQGGQQLTDSDFFKITGDPGAMTKSLEMRDKGRRYEVLGTIGMVIGIAAELATRFTTDNNALTMGLYGGGAIAGLAGGYSFIVGWQMQSPDNHAIDRSQADVDAQNYNARLGRGATLSLRHRF